MSALLLGGFLAQGLIASRLGPPGAAPDLLLLATVVVAAARPVATAVTFGFAAGLAADLFLVTPFGLSAAAYTIIGRAGAALPAPRRNLLVAPRVALSALAGGALVVGGAAALGAGPALSWAHLGPLVRAAVTAAVLSPLLLAALRRLGPSR